MEEMRAFFTRRVEGYDEHMLQNVAGCAEGYELLAQNLPENAEDVLDLGCGTGLELDAMLAERPDLRVTGVDLTQAMLDELKKKHPEANLRLICGDTREAEALLKPNSVHLMVTDAPYGVQKGTAGRQDSIGGTIAAALPGWFDVLKVGGVLAMSFNTHVTKRDGLVRLFEKAGFEIVQTANLEHWVEQAISRDVILARKP